MEFRDLKQKVSIPLYKYYANTNFAKDAICNKRFHLEKPTDYNDIYDSSFSIEDTFLNIMHFNIYKIASLKWYFDFLAMEEIELPPWEKVSVGEIINQLCEKSKMISKERFRMEVIDALTNGKRIVQADNNKISCFSEVNNSLLLWAYYADNYAGVCVRFNAPEDEILSKHCGKVQYTNHYIVDNSFANYFRKSIQWSHEQEWRIVCDTNEEYISTDSIDGIYLGIRMKEDIVREFVELGKKYNIDVYKMFLSDTKYELEFVKISETEDGK